MCIQLFKSELELVKHSTSLALYPGSWQDKRKESLVHTEILCMHNVKRIIVMVHDVWNLGARTHTDFMQEYGFRFCRSLVPPNKTV